MEVIERETIRKQQKALLIFADSWFTRNKQHMTTKGLAPWTDTIGGRLDQDFPGRLYVIAPLRSGEFGFCEAGGINRRTDISRTVAPARNRFRVFGCQRVPPGQRRRSSRISTAASPYIPRRHHAG